MASPASQRTRVRPDVQSPQDLPAPEPHLPLRKASAHRLQNRKGSAPRPLFMPAQQHQVRGFNPSPVRPLPHIDNVTASSEHAFAGRDARRPFKPPLGVQHYQNRQPSRPRDADQRNPQPPQDGRQPRSPLLPPDISRRSPRLGIPPLPPPSSGPEHGKVLKNSKSLGDGLRGTVHHSSRMWHDHPDMPHTPDSLASVSGRPTDELRDSFRSALTSTSSFAPASSVNTDRSSLTQRSSHSDLTHSRLADWHDGGGTGLSDVDMSVEDAIGMYEEGFESGNQSFEVYSARSFDLAKPSPNIKSARSADGSRERSPDVKSAERPISQPHARQDQSRRARPHHRRSQSASILLTVSKSTRTAASPAPTVTETVSPSNSPAPPASGLLAQPGPPPSGPVPRDRYGFKKATNYITVAEYDAWDAVYSGHLERRTRKWQALMRSYGLTTESPLRFPPKSDKIKRYVRKGIPPEYRGAAWFWYAGGPGKLVKEPGLYRQLVQKVADGMLGETDREHIERDLNRTFPDNIRFKPDPSPTATNDPSTSPADPKPPRIKSTLEPETPIVRSLRRVLQAFAIHNPNIGYCQSLNFIAGLLLIFLDSDEEKAFILLNIVTSLHLPGTHGVALEGANIDIAVLMSCLKDSLPSVWHKLDDKSPSGPGNLTSGVGGALRLPTVSLATTAWFMSLFVGTLPIEAVLRTWDCLFFEGSKSLFRIALAIFKAAEPRILTVQDPMEVFQLVQSVPRGLLDVNALLETCFKRRGGFAFVSQGLVEIRREDMRRIVGQAGAGAGARKGSLHDSAASSSTANAAELALKRIRGRWRSRTAK